MNYKKIYDDLVAKAKVRGLDKTQHEGYFEIHHIVPRCLGGDDSKENLVMFTTREHILAHLFLWKAYPKHAGLVNAAQMMCLTREYGKLLPSRVLEKLRNESLVTRSLRKEGAGYGETRHIDLSGQRFGRLVVSNNYEWYTFPSGQRKAKWKCKCDCGNTVSVIVNALNSGTTQSCGCLMRERASQANSKWNVTRSSYAAYHNMLSRCYKPSHKSFVNFRKFNIKVCDDWLGEEGLLNFVRDMGEKPQGLQLIRLNPFSDFCKENCRWVTKAEASKSIYKFPRKNKPSDTGKTGVKFDKRRNSYVARVVIDGVEKSKSFKTLEEAVEFREFIEEELKLGQFL